MPKKYSSYLWTIVFISLLTQHIDAQPLSLPQEKLNLLKNIQTKEVEEVCEKAKETGVGSWLFEEIKNTGFENYKIETTQVPGWQGEIQELRFGDEEIEGIWIKGSYGTYGDFNLEKIKNANDPDGKILSGPIVNVGFGTDQSLKGISGIEGKFWLLERSKFIPNPAAVALTAFRKKALGVIIFDTKDGLNENLWANQKPIPIPVIIVKNSVAKRILLKIKKNAPVLNLSLETHFPKNRVHEHVLVKNDDTNFPFILSARIDNCRETATLLQIMDWIKKSQVSIHWSYFVFFNEREDIKKNHPEWAKSLAKEFSLEGVGPQGLQDFVVNWLKVDHSPASFFDLKNILSKGTKIASNLKGVIDEDRLRKFNDLLHRVEGIQQKDLLSYELNQIFLDETVTQIQKWASDYKTIQMMYQALQRGHWEKAKVSCKYLDGFDFAENLGSEAFTEIQKEQQTLVDPQIWGLFAGGIENLDKLLDVFELEQDGLEKRLTDYFFKLETSLDKLVGLNISARSDTNDGL